MTLSDVKPLHCQKIFYDMADQEYRTSTIYQARIALYNMFEYAKENEQNQFFEMLDRGIDDMEAGRELPVQEAFQKINELRTVRRNARV